MRVLIIDNKDSFTYNIKHYISYFIDDIDVIRAEFLHLDKVAVYQKILFSPGPGVPKEHPVMSKVLDKYGSSKSILGVCLGQQAIAEFYGLELELLLEPMHGVSSRLNHFNNCTLFDSMPNSFNVGHYHSWVISDVPSSSVLELTSVNKEGIAMSIKHKYYDIKGVQFHPESILTENGLTVIKNWLLC